MVIERLLARTNAFALHEPNGCGLVDNLRVRRHERMPIVVEAA